MREEGKKEEGGRGGGQEILMRDKPNAKQLARPGVLAIQYCSTWWWTIL